MFESKDDAIAYARDKQEKLEAAIKSIQETWMQNPSDSVLIKKCKEDLQLFRPLAYQWFCIVDDLESGILTLSDFNQMLKDLDDELQQ